VGGRFSFDVRLNSGNSVGSVPSLEETARRLLVRLGAGRWRLDLPARPRGRCGEPCRDGDDQLNADLAPLEQRGSRVVVRARVEESLTIEQWHQRDCWRFPFWLAEAACEVQPAECARLLRELVSELKELAPQCATTRAATYLVL
jgi:hypothetical protein